jgi:hypothetical protein
MPWVRWGVDPAVGDDESEAGGGIEGQPRFRSFEDDLFEPVGAVFGAGEDQPVPGCTGVGPEAHGAFGGARRQEASEDPKAALGVEPQVGYRRKGSKWPRRARRDHW